MKFTLSWLKEHLATEANLDVVIEALLGVGLEVEEVVDRAAATRSIHRRARQKGRQAPQRRPSAEFALSRPTAAKFRSSAAHPMPAPE